MVKESWTIWYWLYFFIYIKSKNGFNDRKYWKQAKDPQVNGPLILIVVDLLCYIYYKINDITHKWKRKKTWIQWKQDFLALFQRLDPFYLADPLLLYISIWNYNKIFNLKAGTLSITRLIINNRIRKLGRLIVLEFCEIEQRFLDTPVSL